MHTLFIFIADEDIITDENTYNDDDNDDDDDDSKNIDGHLHVQRPVNLQAL